MFSIRRKVGYASIGEDGHMKLSSLVDFCQDCEGFQLDADPVVQRCKEENNAEVFILLRQMDILRPIDYGETLTVRTGVFREERIQALRNTHVYDENGDIVVKGYGIGTVVSFDNGHPVRRTEEYLKQYTVVPMDEDMEYLPRKISVKDREIINRHDPIPVTRWHLDKNRHVNNARYMDMVLDFLPEAYDPMRVRISYVASAAAGDIICPVEYSAEAGYRVFGLLSEEGSTYVTMEFKDRV